MAHTTRWAGENEVILNGYPFRVYGPVDYSLVNIHGRKTNQGDPGPDDHPVNSTWGQRDWSSGGQTFEGHPDTSAGRFWWSTLFTEYPHVLTLPPFTYEDTAPSGSSGNAVMVGDYQNNLYAAWGTGLRRKNWVSGAWEVVGTLDPAATAEGTVYVPREGVLAGSPQLYIPAGVGYSRLNGSVLTSFNSTSAVDFEVWDNKLFRLQQNGVLMYTVDGTTWLDIGVSPTRISDDFTPKRLVSYFDRGGDAALHVITDGGAYALDYDNAVLHKMELEFPRHPYQGNAAEKWRGSLFINVGTGAHRTNGELIGAMGLDRDDGLPADFVGQIVDFAPSYNYLFALVAGEQEFVESPDTIYQMRTGIGQNTFYGAGVTSNALLVHWNGFGWHYRWHSVETPPANVVVSQAQSQYVVVWAAGTSVYHQKLARNYFNPKDSPGGAFAESGTHESFWHDWGWKGQAKIAKQIEFLASNIKTGDRIEVYYKIDREENAWVLVASVAEDGEYSFKIGCDELSGDCTGVQHERIKLRFDIYRAPGVANIDHHPIIEWHQVIARKFLRPQRTWRFRIDFNETYKANPGIDMMELLETWASTPGAITFNHRNRDYMVDIVAVNGPDQPGTDERSFRQISLIESFEVV